MPFLGLCALCNSYRSFIFSGSRQINFIYRKNVKLKANFQNITTCVSVNPYLHQFNLKANFSRHYCSKSVTVVFQLPDGTLLKRNGKVGDSVRSTVEENDPKFQGYGCCLGGVSCGGCHVVLSDKDYAKLSEPGRDENDELDKVPELTLTSRLACAIPLVPEMEGMILRIPKFDTPCTRNVKNGTEDS